MSAPAMPSRRMRSGAAAAAPALLLSLAGCSAGAGGIPAPTPEAPLRGLDRYIEQAVEDWGIAGLSIAVVAGDSIVFAEGYGVRDVRTGEPVDAHSVFAIGSNTKLFTAVTAGMMVDEERMSWDDPAARHLPGFQLHDPYVSREITIRDLLSHRSGLGRRGDLLWYGSGLSRDEILTRIRHLEPNASFRSEFGYQNVMFLAAGEAVAHAADATWDEVVRERIFQPLGMRRSTTSTLQLDSQANVAAPHVWNDGRPVPVPYRNIDNVAPAGSINSSAIEMAQWIRLILGEGSIEGRRLVDSATIAEIMTPHTITTVGSDSLFPSTHFGAYGLGIGLRDYQGTLLASHTGGIDGMLSLVGLLPEEDVGVVILTNTAGHNNLHTALMYRVFDAYLGAPTRDWSGIFLRRLKEQEARMAARQEEMGAARVPGTSPSLALQEYAGTYEDELYGEIEIASEGDGLVMRFGPSFAADLEHWHYNTFRPVFRGESAAEGMISFVTFQLDRSGEVERVEVEGIGEFEREG